MNRAYIVTDSSVQFPSPRFEEHHRVTVVPASLQAPGREQIEGIHNNLAGLRHMFKDPATAPRLVGPSVEQFVEVYQKLRHRTDEILSIHASPSVSNATANAYAASQMFLGRCNIQVIDSKSISVGLGLLVKAAVEAIEKGFDFDQLVRIVHGMIPRLYAIFFLEDLMFLERNGLTSRSQAILGNMLGIIPFLTIEEGRIIPMEKVRSKARAAEKIIEFVSEFSDLEYIALLQEGLERSSAIHSIADRLHSMYPNTPISITSYNLAMATFIGLNSLGAIVLEGEQDSL